MLYPHQKASIDFHLKHHYSINASEMGTGKTRIALETAVAAGAPSVAVFCPAFLVPVWEAELKRYKLRALIVPYSQLHKYSPKNLAGYPFWIADESAYLKSPTTNRTSAFYSLLKACVPDRLVMLSGTPIKNRVPDIWTTLGFCSLNPHNTSGLPLSPPLNRWRSFCRHFCLVDTRTVNGRSFEKYIGLQPSKVDEFRKLLDGKMIRFEAKDVLKDLPAIVETTYPVEIAPTPGLEEEFQAYMAGRKVDSSAKSLSAMLKAPHTAAYAEGLAESGAGPILIFTDHVAPAQTIASILRNSTYITGQTPMYARQDAVSRFQSGRLNFLVATIQSLGVGVTLTASSQVVFNDLSWVPADNEQARARIHRIGQDRICGAHYVVGSATDSYIRRVLTEKATATREALG